MSRLGDWLDDRLGTRRAVKDLIEHPLAGGPSWASALGTTVGFLLLVLVATGAALMTTYAPSETTAWASVHYTQFLAPHGWLVRGVHHFAGESMLVLAAAHAAMLAITGGGRRPRELGFWAALGIVGLAALLCITGAALPWDQQGFWARKVELGILAALPGGNTILRLAIGDGALGPAALTRFFALHAVLLPLLTWSLVRVRRRSDRAYARALAERHSVSEAYFPRQVSRDVALAASALIVALWLAYRMHGAALDAPADPRSDYPARPEWYLLWLYELRHHLHGNLELPGTALAPVALLVLFALVPWLGKRGAATSWVGIVVVIASASLVGSMSYLGWKRDAGDAKYQAARRKAQIRSSIATELARDGVPPDGPLAMLARDPELRGEALFTKYCATCHVLGALGDPKKTKAPTLDGWGSESWNLAMLHEPDAQERFGNTPYEGEMPSADVPPKEDAESFKPLTKDEMDAVAAFLSSQADEPGEPIDPKAVRNVKTDVGQKLVVERCTTCHLYEGKGDDGGKGLAPELHGYGSFAWTRAQLADPATPTTYREGARDPQRKGHMPALAEELPSADLDLLARWTRAHARGVALR